MQTKPENRGSPPNPFCEEDFLLIEDRLESGPPEEFAGSGFQSSGVGVQQKRASAKTMGCRGGFCGYHAYYTIRMLP